MPRFTTALESPYCPGECVRVYISRNRLDHTYSDTLYHHLCSYMSTAVSVSRYKFDTFLANYSCADVIVCALFWTCYDIVGHTIGGGLSSNTIRLPGTIGVSSSFRASMLLPHVLDSLSASLILGVSLLRLQLRYRWLVDIS